MVRVLRISAGLDPSHGGPPVSTAMSCIAAHRAGVETTVAAVEEGSPAHRALAEVAQAGIAVSTFPLARRLGRVAWRWSVSPTMARWLAARAGGFDVLHAHGGWTFTTLAALAAAKLRRRPAVLTPHESLTEFDVAKSGLPERVVKRTLRRLYFRAFDAIVFASELEETNSLPKRHRARSIVVNHPLEPASPVRRESGNGPLRVGFLGRLHAKKNVDLLLRALPANVELSVAGDGPPELCTTLRRLAHELGLDDRVEWLGFVGGERKREFLAAIDLLALPSAHEGFGVAAAEALAVGVPVLVTEATGIAALVRRYECGFVVPPTVDGVRAILERPEGLPEKSARAVVAVERELGLEAHGRRLRGLYEDLTRRAA